MRESFGGRNTLGSLAQSPEPQLVAIEGIVTLIAVRAIIQLTLTSILLSKGRFFHTAN